MLMLNTGKNSHLEEDTNSYKGKGDHLNSLACLRSKSSRWMIAVMSSCYLFVDIRADDLSVYIL